MRRAATTLLFVVAGLVAVPTVAQAQTVQTLVSNIGQSDSGSGFSVGGADDWMQAQRFTTGDNADGYTLSSVDVQIDGTQVGNDPRVSIYSESSGLPGDSVHVLSAPSSFENGVQTFTAQPGANLEKETDYFIVVEEVNTSSQFSLRATSSDDENTGAASGWSIHDNKHAKGTGNWFSGTSSLFIEVKGTLGKTTDMGSNDATLSALVLTDGDSNTVSLSPTFASARTTYTASVANTVSRITVNPTSGNSGASVAYLDEDDAELDDADGDSTNGFQVDLSLDDNVIQVKVTAENNVTTQTYKVTVSRPGQVCTAPDLGGRTEVWRATLTVGHIGMGRTAWEGYLENEGGELSDTSFDFRLMTWTVHELRIEPTGNLNFDVTGTGDREDLELLSLHFCDDVFEIAAAGKDGTSRFEWPQAKFGIVNWLSTTTIEVVLSAPHGTNRPPGQPVIEGVVAVTKELKADIDDIRDYYGLPDASGFSYRWVRVDKSDVETEIGSNSKRYTVSSEDLGSEIKVEVSFTDTDNNRQTFVSDPAGPVVDSDGQMVGNWGNHGADNPGDVEVGPDRWVAQQFTTGHHGGGYQLTTIRVIGGTKSGRGLFRGSIWNTGGDGNPGQKLFDLTTTTGSGVAYLTAPPTHRLERWTDYFVVLEPPASGNYEVPSAKTNVSVSLPGWNIANHHHTREDEDEPWTVDHSRTLQMTIRASTPFPVASLDELKVINADGSEAGVEPPLRWSSDSTGTVKRETAVATIVATPTDEDAAVRFRRGDGTPLPDADTNKDHHQVRLWSYANPVEIMVTSTDGSRERIYNLMVRRLGLGTQEPATGRLVIGELRDRHNRRRAPQVGDTLTVDASDVTDPNGTFYAETGSVLNRFKNGFRFLWRVEADDPNTVIGIGGGRSVTLDKNREGRRIWVTMCFRDDLDNLECIESDKTRPVEGEPLVFSNVTKVLTGSRCDYVYPAGTHCDAETSARDIGSPLKVLNRVGVDVTEEVTFSLVSPSRRTVYDEFGNVHEARYEFAIDSSGQLQTVGGGTYPFLEAPICTRDKNTDPCPAGTITRWAADPVEVKVRATASNGRYGTVSIPVYVLPHPSAVEVSAAGDTRCNDKQCYGRTLIPEQKLYASNQQQELQPLTASFEELPATHDGSTPFTFQVNFSADIDNTADEVSAALQVTGGEVTETNKVDDRSDLWLIQITPGGNGTISIALNPNTECGTAGALCTSDGRAPTTLLAITVLGPQQRDQDRRRGILNDPALTASFEEVPASHDGETAFFVQLAFSQPVFEGSETVDKNRAVREALDVSGGTVQGSGRVVKENFDRYWFNVRPSGNGAVTIALDPPTGECTDSTVACTPDGRKLAGRVETTIQGPAPGVSVADATVAEGEGAVLAFAVELGRAASGAVSVDYATRDVTATAGEDYAETSGTLTFAAGETRKTIEVPVMPDARSEGDETLTLELSNPSGAYLADSEATGTIENTESVLTASFENVPAEHDGESWFEFEVSFSEAFKLGYRTLRDRAFTVTNGRVTRANRIDNKHHEPNGLKPNRRWTIRVRPDSAAQDVTIVLPATADCGASGAVCTGDGRKLSTTVSATVVGPPSVSVADAQVDEGENAVLEFAVALSRAAGGTVTVDYATSDVSATAGADYTETSGTLTFAPGETAKTVNVPVLDDSHDEGNETMTLTLSNAAGAYIEGGEATATGTIENSDLMPQAWLARFGRTVAEQVLDAVEGRVRSAPTAGVRVTVAGQAIGGAAPDAEALEEAEAKARLEGLSAWLVGETCGEGSGAGSGAGGDCPGGRQSRTVGPRELLTGSSFALTAKADGMGGGLVSLWGRGAVSRFDGREGDLTLDGEVTGALLGADWTRERSTLGLMLNHARGEGGYRGADSGEVISTVTGLHPYGRYVLTDRVTLWGTVGYGAGTLTLTPQGAAALETDMDLAMAAVGLRGTVIEAPPEGGPELALKTDALVVRAFSEALRDGAANLAATVADVTRLRLGLEGTWRGLAIGTGTLAPRLEIGVRHDGGDAETGFGLDLGAGLAWSDPGSGIRVEASGRGLLTHEAGGFRELGIAGSLGWDPVPDSERGPRLTLTRSLGGSARGGAEALLGRTTLAGLAADGGSGGELERTELRLGYGFGAFGGRYSLVPEAGLGMSGERREYSLGWRLVRDRRGDDAGSLEFALEARRREGASDGAGTEQGAGVRITARW